MSGKTKIDIHKNMTDTELDEEMRMYFKRDRKATHAWENVKDVAASTNPILNNLSNLFKRK